MDASMARAAVKKGSLIVAVLVGVLVVPKAASPQSAIAGVVKDPSGAVLPGVTVEAASEVLIEKAKTVLTDSAGLYRIVDLRPGIYTVTFTQPGFQTVKREVVELPAEFTATINVEMKVGAIQETHTIAASSPVVDVQSAAHVHVLSREIIETIPTGRTIQGIAQALVGISLNLPDVGGSRAAAQTFMSVRGQSPANNTVMVDGMTVNGLEANGAVQGYFNDAASQEMSYQTSGIGAETSGGGVRLNLIPREGGNRLNGDAAWSYRPGSWQGDNLTQRLIDAGLRVSNSTKYISDVTASQGGPVKQDRLWFFGSFRDYRTNNRIPNTFYDDGTQGDDLNYIRQGLVRLTLQLGAKHKIAAFYDRVNKYRGHSMQSLTDPETASEVWPPVDYHTAAVKYSSPASPRMLVEAGYSENVEWRAVDGQPGIMKERGTPEWFASASRTAQSTTLGGRTTAPSIVGLDYPTRRNMQGSLSYVTGSHNIKAGVQYQWGDFYHSSDANADLTQRYLRQVLGPNGAIEGFVGPADVVVRNTPLESRERLNYDIGLFAQDSWTLRRLTVNGGIRWEAINSQVDRLTAPAGRFVPARTAPERRNLPNWRDWAPRLNVVYDLFGNARTAVKYSVNRYNAAQAVGIAALFNPLSSTTVGLTWIDGNNDNIAQGSRVWNAAGTAYVDCGGAPYPTPGVCEINLGALRPNFGLLSDAGTFAGYPRGYNVEHGFEVQHELLPRVSVTGSYYFGRNYNLTNLSNALFTGTGLTTGGLNRALQYGGNPLDNRHYRPLEIFNPITGERITVYDILATSKALASDTVTDLDPSRANRYTSVVAELTARFARGARVAGGIFVERELSTNCEASADPNNLRFCDRTDLPPGLEIPFSTNLKMIGVYPLPWQGIVVSGVLQSIDGGARTVRLQISRTARYPDGSNPRFPRCPAPCPAGALIAPTLNGTYTGTTLTIPLFPSGSRGYRGERLNQLDLKVSKPFRVGRVKVTPSLEAFNVTNQDMIITYASTNYNTASYLQPNSLLQGRILGAGASIKW
jgi:hypothetical protein